MKRLFQIPIVVFLIWFALQCLMMVPELWWSLIADFYSVANLKMNYSTLTFVVELVLMLAVLFSTIAYPIIGVFKLKLLLKNKKKFSFTQLLRYIFLPVIILFLLWLLFVIFLFWKFGYPTTPNY